MDIQTSEIEHTKKYGTPEECYKIYRETNLEDHKNHLDFVKGEFDKVEEKYILALNHKHKLLSTALDFTRCRNILDVGGSGSFTNFLANTYEDINSIACIDGNTELMRMLGPYLHAKIALLECDFYDNFFKLPYQFDTILQIDFPEHLPDILYANLTKRLVEDYLTKDGELIIYTPEYPLAWDQIEHISVKNIGFYVNALGYANLKIEKIVKVNSKLIITAKRR